ncbi:AAA family ATPase [Micromonospora sp. WMMD961]|uniref:AAA family ATPase n=1 Tax=Micromonospora sp. WMMD961 TaxID=3016100 RepID=UPI002415BE2B|nr:AAA family ATPase [Micromonospora sp. WMMD961]MDG4780781.1 AAA family ATPase [Micromonospora sp. WMMD961]
MSYHETPDSRLVVITGGPGSGKTALVDALHLAGYRAVPEAGRAIVTDQRAIGGSLLPWNDPALFDELVLAMGMRAHADACATGGTAFFDHAIPCTVGFIRARAEPVPAHFRAAVARFRYHPTVFVAPPWPAIYRRDEARWETFEQAQGIHAAIVEAYREVGYRCVELPRADVATRVRVVLDLLGDGDERQHGGGQPLGQPSVYEQRSGL